MGRAFYLAWRTHCGAQMKERDILAMKLLDMRQWLYMVDDDELPWITKIMADFEAELKKAANERSGQATR